MSDRPVDLGRGGEGHEAGRFRASDDRGLARRGRTFRRACTDPACAESRVPDIPAGAAAIWSPCTSRKPSPGRSGASDRSWESSAPSSGTATITIPSSCPAASTRTSRCSVRADAAGGVRPAGTAVAPRTFAVMRASDRTSARASARCRLGRVAREFACCCACAASLAISVSATSRVTPRCAATALRSRWRMSWESSTPTPERPAIRMTSSAAATRRPIYGLVSAPDSPGGRDGTHGAGAPLWPLGSGRRIWAVAAEVAVFWPPALLAVTLTMMVSPRSSPVGV